MSITTWSQDIILCLIAIKTITGTKKILCINYSFKDLISKQIISQFQLLWDFIISLKTVCQLVQNTTSSKILNYLTQHSRFHIWNCFYERLSPCPHDSHTILYKPLLYIFILITKCHRYREDIDTIIYNIYTILEHRKTVS